MGTWTSAEWEKIAKTVRKAKKKGLTVSHNSFKPGWSITLPGNTVFHAKTDDDMVRFVTGY